MTKSNIVLSLFLSPSQMTLKSAQTIGFFRTIIAIYSQLVLHNSLHAIAASSSFYEYTMNVNGLVYLTAGDYISVWIYSANDRFYYIDTDSGFSAFYLGSLYSHIGFANDMTTSVLYRRRGWYEIKNWGTYYPFHFQGDSSFFNGGNGRFTAPCTGLYYAAANIRLDSATGASFTVSLYICELDETSRQRVIVQEVAQKNFCNVTYNFLSPLCLNLALPSFNGSTKKQCGVFGFLFCF